MAHLSRYFFIVYKFYSKSLANEKWCMYKYCARKTCKKRNNKKKTLKTITCFISLSRYFVIKQFMLKALFSSNTRIKLLNTFLLNLGEEFFIRELTRKLDEQINSIRRELDNLKRIGLLRSKVRNRKKYYYVNKDFIIFNELRDMFIKASSTDEQMARKILKMGEIELMVLSGIFIGKDSQVDLLIVGEVDKNKLQEYLSKSTKLQKDIKFTIISKKDFLYRLECKDRFVHDMVTDSKNLVLVNKLRKELEKFNIK